MIILLSPAKDLDTEPIKGIKGVTKPALAEKSVAIADVMQRKSAKQLGKLMDISDKLAELNHERYQLWKSELEGQGKTAIHAFNGEVYKSLDAKSLSASDLNYAQDHVRILSGLYGILRPKDEIMPYRLEMGTKVNVKRKKGLYDYWGSDITERINEQVEETGSRFIINLASNEYFKSVKAKDLSVSVITPVFKDLTAKGDYRTKFFFAKKQRGKMTRFLCQHQALEPKVLLNYDVDGYYYSAEQSSADKLVFLRDKPI